MSRRGAAVKRLPVREADILRGCLDVLALYPNILGWRQNTGAFAGEYKGRKRFIRFGLPGQADITGIIAPDGRRLEVECKAPGRGTSPEQAVFAAWIQKHGGLYLLVRSPQELVDALTREGIRPRRIA